MIKKTNSFVLKNIKTVLSSPLPIIRLNAFFGTSPESSIWGGGRQVSREKDKKMVKVLKSSLISIFIKDSSSMAKRMEQVY